jgi:hypothetical protein
MSDAILADGPHWICPWCNTIAALETRHPVICYSRTGECGSVALGAPPWDSDEIIDDAIGIFAVEIRPQSRGFDPLLMDDIRRGGVEVRTGALVQGLSGMPALLKYQFLWFRRSRSVGAHQA